jgi:multidrug efflux pump subunit AcrA (membrane-fusion protein)
VPLGSTPRRRRRFWAVGAAATLLAGGGWFALGPTASADTGVETAEVVRGDFIDVLPIRGEVRARRTVPITAPRSAGDLQIVYLAASAPPSRRATS